MLCAVMTPMDAPTNRQQLRSGCRYRPVVHIDCPIDEWVVGVRLWCGRGSDRHSVVDPVMSSDPNDHHPQTLATPIAPAPRETSIRSVDAAAALAEIRAAHRRVVTFVGFSGAGYEDADALARIVAHTLSSYDPRSVTICIGATTEGIGAAYPIARQRGFRTLGIVSSRAQEDGVTLSSDVDIIYVIPDTSWGGNLPDGRLSPVSAAMVEAADEIIAIGGGDIARDEAAGAIAAGKPVRYIAADMNHAAAIEHARRAHQPEPRDFRGTLQTLFPGSA
jgi:hypothetical protein